MRITKYLHSCLLVEEENSRFLFDPGFYLFTEKKFLPEDFFDISAIIITHRHRDHVEVPALKKILSINPTALVFGNIETKTFLQKEHIEVVILNETEQLLRNVTLRMVDASHESILKPAPQNSAYILGGKFLHPGDSFDECLFAWKGIEVLCLPVMGSWMTVVHAGEFAKTMRPKTVIPIHDGFLKEFYLDGHYSAFREYFQAAGMIFYPLQYPHTFEF